MMFDLESVGEAFGVLLMQVCLTALAAMLAACAPCLLVKATGRPLRELWRKSRPLFAALALLSAGAMIHAQKTNGVFMTGLTGLAGTGNLVNPVNPVQNITPVQTSNKGRFVMGMKLAAVTVASIVGLAASAYTNMQQLVNVRITPEVLAQMPTNDFSSPQMTVLCFERAMRLGDCTNLFNCCSLEYNLRNLGITNVAQISCSTRKSSLAGAKVPELQAEPGQVLRQAVCVVRRFLSLH